MSGRWKAQSVCLTGPSQAAKPGAMSNMQPFSTDLRADNLTLTRGGRSVLSGLSLTAEPGDAILLTGQNGAGKTTLLRVLCGLMLPEAGQVMWSARAARHSAPLVCAWLGHADGLKPAESVRAALKVSAALFGRGEDAVDAALAAMKMDALDERPCGRLSRGQQRRAAIARVILSGRPVWLLDEPAGPLDTDGRALLAAAVASHRDQGGLVVAATHQVLDWPDAQIVRVGE